MFAAGMSLLDTIELGGLLAHELGAQGAFWSWLENINVSALGLIIVGMFLATWTVALSVWHFGHL